MNCAEFEQGLARWVVEEIAGDEGKRLVEELRAHASSCDGCSGNADLIAVLDSPAGQRDIVEDPGEAYWSGFEPRLVGRIEELPAPRRVTARAYWIAAAVIAVALVTGSLLLGPRDPAPSIAGREGAYSDATPTDPAELPDSLVMSVTQASVEEVEDQLTVLEGWGDGDAFFPDVEQLDSETRTELLDWLRDQNSGLEGAKG
jgi:hypothetical protein